MALPNQSIVTLIVYNLHGRASCHGAFKPSSIYKWLSPHTIGSHLFTFITNSRKLLYHV